MALLVVGFNHTTAPVAVRERLVFAERHPRLGQHRPQGREVGR
jgi:glutamyl-tRNA reductase